MTKEEVFNKISSFLKEYWKGILAGLFILFILSLLYGGNEQVEDVPESSKERVLKEQKARTTSKKGKRVYKGKNDIVEETEWIDTIQFVYIWKKGKTGFTPLNVQREKPIIISYSEDTLVWNNTLVGKKLAGKFSRKTAEKEFKFFAKWYPKSALFYPSPVNIIIYTDSSPDNAGKVIGIQLDSYLYCEDEESLPKILGKKHSELRDKGTSEYSRYKVPRGETLKGIALRFGVSVNDIINANPVLRRRELRAFETINIPK